MDSTYYILILYTIGTVIVSKHKEPIRIYFKQLCIRWNTFEIKMPVSLAFEVPAVTLTSCWF